MRYLLLVLAVLSILLGMTVGGIGIGVAIVGDWDSGGFWGLLIMIPFVCFGAIATIIGIRYLTSRNLANARGIAGMTGFLVYSTLDSMIARRYPDDLEPSESNLFFFLGPILVGYLLYRIFFWIIQISLNKHAEIPGEELT